MRTWANELDKLIQPTFNLLSEVGQIAVAKYIKKSVGDRNDQITKDRTPSSDDFVINLRTGERRAA